MRFRLRTLLIAVAIIPPILAPVSVWVWRKIQDANQISTEPGYLGMIPDESSNNVTVLQVRKGGPADIGGLLPNDVITHVNGQPCPTLDAFDGLYGEATVGSRLKLTVARNGASRTLIVRLGKRPGHS